MDRDESAARRGCQEVGAGLASWERWAGKRPEAAGNSQPSPQEKRPWRLPQATSEGLPLPSKLLAVSPSR